MKGNRYEMDMRSGSLAGKILVFAFPLMLSGTLQLLNGLVLLLLIVGVFLLDFLHPGLDAGHFHHTLLAFSRDRQQYQLYNEGKDDDGQAIVAGQLVQKADQPTKGNGNDLIQVTFSLSSGYRVVEAALIKRIAAQKAFDGEPSALQGPVFGDCFVGVGGTSGSKPAGWGRTGR